MGIKGERWRERGGGGRGEERKKEREREIKTFNFIKSACTTCAYITGNNGDYDESGESDEDDEEGDGEQVNGGVKVNALRAFSMGCTEEEEWKRCARTEQYLL